MKEQGGIEKGAEVEVDNGDDGDDDDGDGGGGGGRMPPAESSAAARREEEEPELEEMPILCRRREAERAAARRSIVLASEEGSVGEGRTGPLGREKFFPLVRGGLSLGREKFFFLRARGSRLDERSSRLFPDFFRQRLSRSSKQEAFLPPVLLAFSPPLSSARGKIHLAWLSPPAPSRRRREEDR